MTGVTGSLPDDSAARGGVRRLEEACVDAVDCLTRAAALYAQHWEDAAFPMSALNQVSSVIEEQPDGSFEEYAVRVTSPSSAESTPPPSGDMETQRLLRGTARHVGRCVGYLRAVDDGLPGGLGRDPSPYVLRLVVERLCQALRLAQRNAGDLDVETARLVHHACAAARSALAVWDTPPETDEVREAQRAVRKARRDLRSARESGDRDAVDDAAGTLDGAERMVKALQRAARRAYGTALTPPEEWVKVGRRCRTCGWRKAERDRTECSTCRTERTGRRSA